MSATIMAEQTSPLDRPITVTIWKDQFASEKTEGLVSLRQFSGRIIRRTAAKKEDLWWLKLAKFGDVRTEKGSLRNNDNVLAIDGLEADYDAGEVDVERAVEIAEKAGLACIVYTSPSHTPEKPKWRVLAPFSQTLDPADRDHMMGRLNGLYGGIFAAESWTLSQSYYYGCVDGHQFSHRVEAIDGQGIDELDELDEVWRPKPTRIVRFTDGQENYSAYNRHMQNGPLDVEAAKHNIRTAQSFHPSIVSLCGHYMAMGKTREETFALVMETLNEVPPELRDRRWMVRSSYRHVNGVLEWVSSRENRRVFRELMRASAATVEVVKDEDEEPEQARPVATRVNGNFVTDSKGAPVANAYNVAELIRVTPAFDLAFGTDTFAGRKVLFRQIPNIPGPRTFQRPMEFNDLHLSGLLAWTQRNGIPKATRTMVADAVDLLCAENEFHPVKDYLSGLEWDGVPRATDWLLTHCGAEATDEAHGRYLREVGRAWLVSAAARVFEPGCKVDTALILEGAQGVGKSTAAATLAGKDWFGDALPHMGTKDAQSYLRGLWIVEMAELANMAKAEVEIVKSFLSRREDRFRPSYGRYEITIPRQCVFIGSTNADNYLRDTTGNRRFWPVRCGRIDTERLAQDRDQLWAEAVYLFRAGASWWLSGDVIQSAEAEQTQRIDTDDPWYGRVLELARGREETGVCCAQILERIIEKVEDRTRLHSERVGRILRSDGWVSDGYVSKALGYGTQKRFVKHAREGGK